MTRRLVWFTTGVGVGVLLTRQVAVSAKGSAAGAVASALATRLRRVADDVIAEGRIEMRQREARLRAVFAAPGHDATGTTEGRR